MCCSYIWSKEYEYEYDFADGVDETHPRRHLETVHREVGQVGARVPISVAMPAPRDELEGRLSLSVVAGHVDIISPRPGHATEMHAKMEEGLFMDGATATPVGQGHVARVVRRNLINHFS